MRISDWSSDVCSSDLIPHINPTNFDASYWALDQLMRPVVDACMFLRRSAFFFIPYESIFYMISYIALFYTSFLYHAIKTPEYFGRLIISALLLQVFGTLAYLGGVCGRGRNPTLRIWASDIPRLV